jgi:hypothetical protein
MMMMRLPILLALLCPSYTLALTNLPAEDESQRYHGDHTCNRPGYNTFKENMQRHLTYQKFKPTGFGAVPNQRTVMCPESVQDLHGDSTQMSGFDTVWIVENTSSDPVVLSYVNPADGIEYSAINSKITPPQDDPDAILQPGYWRPLYTWEGHVFFARQLLQDSDGGQAAKLGPVLMQHRTGLIPIGMNAQDLICPSTDPELNMANGGRTRRTTPSTINGRGDAIHLGHHVSQPSDDAVEKLSDYERVDEFARTQEMDGAFAQTPDVDELARTTPTRGEFTRTPPTINRRCNTIDLGFRNMANCPLNGYYVTQRSDDDDEVENTLHEEEVDGYTMPAAYQEIFKFHLGTNPKSDDFMWGWDSSTKFEGTFVGHTFAFHLAAEPDVLVQTYKLQPTRIPDCPNLKNKHQVNRVTSIGIAQAVVLPTGIMPETTLTNATDSTAINAWNINGTITRHRRRLVAPYAVDKAIAGAALTS